MDNANLKELLSGIIPESTIVEGKQFLEIVAPKDSLHETAKKLQSNDKVCFDFLTTLTAIDFVSKFTMVYHLEATKTHQMVVLKSDIEGRKNPNIDTVSDIFPTAEFHEREVFDMFGIQFNNHPNLKRLFMEDDYGFPLRKDFKDEVNFIELKK